ncbi:hypothetical protein V8C44DRAFT_337611 [Trichoderma aethiopicum]
MRCSTLFVCLTASLSRRQSTTIGPLHLRAASRVSVRAQAQYLHANLNLTGTPCRDVQMFLGELPVLYKLLSSGDACMKSHIIMMIPLLQRRSVPTNARNRFWPRSPLPGQVPPGVLQVPGHVTWDPITRAFRGEAC